MTPQMIDRSRAAAARGPYLNVEFRLGEIENLPVADATADAVVSNCVINLSPDKPRVFREAWRVLKPGGKLMVSDIMLTEPLPEKVRRNVELWAGCVSGALLKEDYLAAVRAAGFTSVDVRSQSSAGDMRDDAETKRLSAEMPGVGPEEIQRIAGSVVSVQLLAVK
jgi:ubiquinone/menaquinone biosynthesis C-methylase UbiE